MSRLTIDISDQQHQALKAMAALQGKSIRQYAIERLFSDTISEEECWNALKATLEQRIASGLAGEVSSKGVLDILNEELRITP